MSVSGRIVRNISHGFQNVLRANFAPQKVPFSILNPSQTASIAATRGAYFKFNNNLLERSKKEAEENKIDLTTPISKATEADFKFLVSHSIYREKIKHTLQEITGDIDPKTRESINSRQKKVYSDKPNFSDPKYFDYAVSLFKKKPDVTIGDIIEKIYRPGGKDIVPPEINAFADLCNKETNILGCKDAITAIRESAKLMNLDIVSIEKLEALSREIDTHAQNRYKSDNTYPEVKTKPKSIAESILEKSANNLPISPKNKPQSMAQMVSERREEEKKIDPSKKKP